MVKLYLVRHGQTEDNVKQILQGQMPGQLTQEGVREAERLCERMKEVPIDVFVSSDLARAIDTCRIIAAPHGKKVVETPLLRERDWGDFTGAYIPDLKDRAWPDNVESAERMMARAKNFITWLRVTYPEQTVLAVGHGIINKMIQSVYYNKPMREIPRMENAEVRVLLL
ncbi:MAG: histidine phosphatase family protein [Prevotellaceae bacterium]|nr:histidine phosphatase family protein [Prevotellaceae bacterium]